jgi:uncharacterized protein with beta-barrel porin domain
MARLVLNLRGEPSGWRRPLLALAGTTFSASLLVAMVAADPARADGGRGGSAFNGSGGGGGFDDSGVAGSNGGNNSGGGGGGAGGGTGGSGGTAGINAGGGAGAAGTGGAGPGGGGGGGNDGGSISTGTTSTNLTGQTGGAGGDSTDGGTIGGGGGGGSGGFGLNVSGSSAINAGGVTLTGGTGGHGGGSSLAGAGAGGDGGGGVFVASPGASFVNSGTIQGGQGGVGGSALFGNASLPAKGGNGGAGGDGVDMSGGGVLSNAGTIAGGNGAAGGTGISTVGGNGGVGGAGIVGANLTIISPGAIAGGVSGGTFQVQANAITFTGGSNILELNPGGSQGTLIGNIGVTGTLTFEQPFDVMLSNIITGNGSIVQNGATLNLSGVNTYTGSTTISDGTLALTGNGSIATSSRVAVGATGTFDISGTTSGASIKSLAGSGTVDLGGQVLTITNANDTFSGLVSGVGGLTLTGGTQTISGTVNSTTTVNGGTLAGNGIINSDVAINTGGTFAPGNGTPGSSMAVGSLALQSGAFYMVQINPTTSSFANVAGNATLGGATVEAFYAAGSYVSKQYTILTAGSITGSFGSLVNTNLPSGFHTSLSNDRTHAYLNLILTFAPPPGSGLSSNQQNVANAVVGFFNSNGSIPMVFGGLTPAGLTQVSGETATGSQQTTFNAMNQFMGVMTDPFIDGRGDGVTTGGNAASGYASTQKTGAARDANAMFTKAMPSAPSFDQRWSVWTAGYGGSQTTDGNAALGSNSTTSSIAGTAVGADYRFSPFTIAGFALAGGGTSFSVANGGSGRSDLFQAGAFVRHNAGPAYISAALAYGWQDITTNRTVTVAGTDMLRAEFNANAFSGRVEGGYRYLTPWLGVTPYAAGQFTTFDLPSYAESVLSGASNFALAYNAKSVTDTRSELGIRTDKSFALTDSILTLRGRVAWAHDYNPDRSIAATFQTLPGASFVVNGAAQAADSALTTASAEFKWTNGWSAAATFEGEFSDVTASYAGKGVVRYAW